jgi:uncharacterized membrane protein YfcA
VGQYLQISLSVFLVGFSLFFLLRPNFTFKTGRKETFIGGSLSGFLAGFLGTGGAIRGLTMTAFNLEKNIYVATSAAIDFGVDLSRTIVYFVNGYMNDTSYKYLPFLIFIGFLGTYIGQKILRKISQEYFKRISLLLILMIGIVSIFYR